MGLKLSMEVSEKKMQNVTICRKFLLKKIFLLVTAGLRIKIGWFYLME